MKSLLVTNIGLLATPVGTGAKSGPAQGDIRFTRDAWAGDPRSGGRPHPPHLRRLAAE